MTDISKFVQRIGIYHSLFLTCLILALVFLAVAVVLFFVLDIRSTIGYLTGRRAKKQIKELEAVTALSGRLMPKERNNMQYVAQEMKDDMGVRQKARPGIRKVEHAVEVATQTTAEIPQGTAVLQTAPEDLATEVLTSSETTGTVQIMAADASTAVLGSAGKANGKFVIVREIVMIHTEEVI